MFSKRVKAQREKLGLNKRQMAEKLEIPYTTYNNYEIGTREPNIETIKRFSDFFGVSADYLMCNDKIVNEWIEKNTTSLGETCMLPVVGCVCAGNGIIAEEDILYYEMADIKYSTGGYFYLQVSGDSMFPKIENGDLVLIKSQSSVDSGSIGVFIIDEEEGVIKKVKYDKEYIELHSFNPMYPVLRFDGADVLRVRVIGKIVESKKKWD